MILFKVRPPVERSLMIRLLLLKMLNRKILKNMLPVFNSKPEIQMNSGNFQNTKISRNWLKKLSTYDFFSFNENDVIEVDLNAPAEPEWFFGTCQGRAGLFPQGTWSDWTIFCSMGCLNFQTFLIGSPIRTRLSLCLSLPRWNSISIHSSPSHSSTASSNPYHCSWR